MRRPKKPIENKEQLRRSTQAANKKQKLIENREQVRRSNFNYMSLVDKRKIFLKFAVLYEIYMEKLECASQYKNVV
jgi:hypothetical protein